MPTREVRDILQEHQLLSPDLEMLRPTEASYTALLMQPCGPIYAAQDRIGPFDRNLAAAKGSAFMSLANEQGAHLAVTPEYSLPWSSLRDAIAGNTIPPADALWVLGCESTTEAELEQFKEEIGQARCLFIHEPWQGLQTDRQLLDPVVLLFNARRGDGTYQLVALVQFKTFPSRDKLFLEENWLRRGTVIYRFRGLSGHLTVATIICSDAFALDDTWLSDFNDRATLIHIQLNPSPRNAVYRRYRTTTFANDARSTNCHIACLNWAQSIEQHGPPGTAVEPWDNIAGSTWYCPADDCSCDDDVVVPNHNLGFYYAYMTERRHALLLHYDEAVFQLRIPKVMTVGPAVMANRNGPRALQRYVWFQAGNNWQPNGAAESGFNALVAETPHAQEALHHVITENDPLGVERFLALSVGAINGSPNWYITKDIDSCQMGPDELVRRVTFVQDPENLRFRHDRLSGATQIYKEILGQNEWPPQVDGVGAASTLRWSDREPNFNVQTADGKPTLIAFLGELPRQREIDNKTDMLYQLLRRAGGKHQTRLCVMYREFGQIKFARVNALTRIDDPLEDKTEFLSVPPFDPAEASHD